MDGLCAMTKYKTSSVLLIQACLHSDQASPKYNTIWSHKCVCVCVLFYPSLPAWQALSLMSQLEPVVIEISIVQVLRLRANLWWLHGAKCLLPPAVTGFYSGQSSYHEGIQCPTLGSRITVGAETMNWWWWWWWWQDSRNQRWRLF